MTDQKSTYWMSALELQLNATSVHYFSLDSPQHSWWFLAFSFKCLYRVHNSLFVCSYILIYWRITSVVCSGTYIFSTPLQMLHSCFQNIASSLRDLNLPQFHWFLAIYFCQHLSISSSTGSHSATEGELEWKISRHRELQTIIWCQVLASVLLADPRHMLIAHSGATGDVGQAEVMWVGWGSSTKLLASPTKAEGAALLCTDFSLLLNPSFFSAEEQKSVLLTLLRNQSFLPNAIRLKYCLFYTFLNTLLSPFIPIAQALSWFESSAHWQ